MASHIKQLKRKVKVQLVLGLFLFSFGRLECLFIHIQSLQTVSPANMDRFGLLSHHHHHHKSQGQGGGKEESTVLVLDPSIAFLYCFFLLAIVMAAICFNFRRRSQAVRVDLRLVQVKRPCDKTFLMTNDLLTGAARAPASFLYEAFLRGAAAKV